MEEGGGRERGEEGVEADRGSREDEGEAGGR